MLERLFKQYKLPWVGGAKEVLAQVAFYVSAINFFLIAVTAYHTTLSVYLVDWVPWMTFPLFMGILIVLLVGTMVLEYKFIVASLYTFRGKQMFEHESQVVDKLNEILKRLDRE